MCALLLTVHSPRPHSPLLSIQHPHRSTQRSIPIADARRAGFMNQFKSVCDPEAGERHIGITLDELSGGAVPTRVLCCGHSLGGALATLAGAWAAYEYPRADIRCITLGSPRVGNRTFCNAMKYLVGDVHRLVHGWDPVPTMPPPTGFTHVKGRMFLYKQKCRLMKRPWCVLPAARCVPHTLVGRCWGCYPCWIESGPVSPRPRHNRLASM